MRRVSVLKGAGYATSTVSVVLLGIVSLIDERFLRTGGHTQPNAHMAEHAAARELAPGRE